MLFKHKKYTKKVWLLILICFLFLLIVHNHLNGVDQSELIKLILAICFLVFILWLRKKEKTKVNIKKIRRESFNLSFFLSLGYNYDSIYIKEVKYLVP